MHIVSQVRKRGSSDFKVLIKYEIHVNLQIDILNLNQYIPRILHFTVLYFQLLEKIK